MGVKFICDGCGKEAPGIYGKDGHWHKPGSWYERGDKDGGQLACSRECVDKIAKKTGKTSVIFPI